MDLLKIVDSKKRLCMQERLKFTNAKGEQVVLRDVFEKIAYYVKKVSDVVDVAVQYDPAHAALPWAGMRFLISITINDIQVYGAMMEGVEFVGRVIARAAVVEDRYLARPSSVGIQLREGLERLYTSILQYLVKASRYYSDRKSVRVLKAININAENEVSVAISSIKGNDDELQPLLGIIDKEGQDRILEISVSNKDQIDSLPSRLDDLQIDISNKLSLLNKDVLDELQRPMMRLEHHLTQLEGRLTESRRNKIFGWLSTITYRKHHTTIIKSVLKGSGKWLFTNEKYNNWWNSSTSSTLWLHGIPGCGKSRLTAQVIQKFLEERGMHDATAPFAYFYCIRTAAEPKRADPGEILRSLLLQLSLVGSEDAITKTIVQEYNNREEQARKFQSDIEPLTVSECINFILQITSNSSATIVIDALDECHSSTRYELMNALEKFVRQSENVVKIFVSSREDGDIVSRMNTIPNVLVSATENRDDIQLFVENAIDRAIEEKRLLVGVVDDKLISEMKASLLDRANGMFQWVNLVIQNLCEPERLQIADDISSEIARLPSDLADLYQRALLQIKGTAPHAKKVAITAMQWLLRAHASLSCEEFTAVIARVTGVTPTQVTTQKVLSLCKNLVIHDTTSNVFRFAHYTVSEYLEDQPEFALATTESMMAFQCLQICIKEIPHMEPRAFKKSEQISCIQYACLHWPIHSFVVRKESPDSLLDAIRNFTKSTRSDWPQYKEWASVVSRFPLRFLSTRMQQRMRMSFSESCHPIFMVVSFELEDLAAEIAHSCDINSTDLLNQFQMTPLVVACNVGNIAIIKILIECGADININHELASYTSSETYWPLNPLIAAIFHHHWEIMRLLLSNGANLDMQFEAESFGAHEFEPPLAMAVKSGEVAIVEELIKAGADVNISTGKSTPIQWAAELGHTGICRLLLNNNANPDLLCNYKYKTHTGAFEIAAREGHLGIVKMLRDVMDPANNSTERINIALANAARQQHYDIVEYLLGQGADSNAPIAPLGTPFLFAVDGGSVDVVTTLIKHGANVNNPGLGYGNALIIAADHSHENVFSLLLEHTADIEMEVPYKEKWNSPRCPLNTKRFIAREGSLAMLKQLVQTMQSLGHNLDLDELLFLAISAFRNKQYIEKVKWLLGSGADVNAQLASGTRPIHIAVQSYNLVLVQMLLEHDALCNVTCSVLGSPLHAVYYRPIGGWRAEDDPQPVKIDLQAEENWGNGNKMASLLLTQDINVNALGGMFGTAIQAASQIGIPEEIKVLLDAGAIDVHQVGYFGSALNAAVVNGNLDVVKVLFQEGFDTEVQFSPYGTALQAAACFARHPASLILVPDRKTGPPGLDPKDALGYTNFLLNKHTKTYQEIFDLLLDRCTNVCISGGIYGSAIQAAAYAGQMLMVEQLIEKGADIHDASGFYGSPLQAACCAESRNWWCNDRYPIRRYSEDTMIFPEKAELSELETDSHAAVVELLLDKKVNVNKKGGHFGTPLQAAVHSDNPEMVQRLLNAGAVVCEDGAGFYGGCISAAISFGKGAMIRWVSDEKEYMGNGAQILGLLFDYIAVDDFQQMVSLAIVRAREKNNDKGLKLLKTAISEHHIHRDAADFLFGDASKISA